MITKTQIIESLDELPENISIDQVIDHLIFLEKVNRGLRESDENHVNSREEAKRKLSKWVK